ncbi:vWA domain-containing protein [Paludisphaera mucosa]|uniref:VWA domain-containing protein n=1 Tax=Paludisphaera mucosa TaxID=3030827 RepID=A0ABT6FJM2_9BACT|nr:vWA domain-containing protein [Paludisphaera mucosa]MDG3007778.1 VWA domain-containing protein [Paludisphaera mucosa]
MLDKAGKILGAWADRVGVPATGRPTASLAAGLISLSIHALVLVSLAFAGHHVQEVVQSEFSSEVAEAPPRALEPLATDSTLQDLDQKDDEPVMEASGSFAPILAATNTAAPPSAGPSPATVDDALAAMDFGRRDVQRVVDAVAPTASTLGKTFAIEGNGAEHVQGVEGAVDRVAVEIVRRLERGRTLVVWAFDASRSLEAERKRLSKHIETIYAHIGQIDENRLSTDGGLLTMVVAFGEFRKAMTPKPTADVAAVRDAIASIPADESGVEATFSTVAEIVNKYGKFKGPGGDPYNLMVIVVTDEVGDDQDRLESTIDAAKKRDAPIYVLGSQALFGRAERLMDYYDPKTKFLHKNLKVDAGPESAMIEQIRLPFWYGGPQYDELESGFGPYALSRLASATGGVYFVARLDGAKMGFDASRMKEYRPDWGTRREYEADVARSPLRQAVVNAALVTQQNLPGMPTLQFPSMDAPEFKDVLQNNQVIAERTTYTIDEALPPITAAAKRRDRETSRRWQAHYDLIRGRLLAMKVRCVEYNWACALLVKDPPRFQDPKSNAWRLVPDAEIRFSEKAALAAKEAEALLRKVVADHPETPWALLAERELKNPLGFRWVEAYVPPPRPRDDDPANPRRKMKKAEEMKPPEPPKL